MENTVRPLNQQLPAELAIYNAMLEVERSEFTGEKLTEVVILLGKAKDLMTQVVDENVASIPERKTTVGESRVRTSFNPDASDVVSQIKTKSAELIDLCEPLKEKDGRLASLAQTGYEEAAMWAVKAATA